MTHSRFIFSLLTFLMFGCSNDRVGPAFDVGGPADGAVLRFDGAMVDSGVDATPRDARADTTFDVGIDSGVDNQRFVPDIPYEYVGSLIEVGVEILAFTAMEDRLGSRRFLVSLRNTSVDVRLCALTLDTEFFNAAGTRIGRTRGLVESPPHRGVGGTGGLVECVSPGQIGMQNGLLELGDWEIADIASATWVIGALNLTDAVPTDDLSVTDVGTITADFGAMRFTGLLTNNSTANIRSPQISVFALNSVGRPLVVSRDIELITIIPRGSWRFETLSVDETSYTSLAVFPQARDM